jgi:hypothetical protein
MTFERLSPLTFGDKCKYIELLHSVRFRVTNKGRFSLLESVDL